jgi:hypothetical protein
VPWEAGADCVACVLMPLACVAGPPVAPLRLPRRPKPAPPSGPAAKQHQMGLRVFLLHTCPLQEQPPALPSLQKRRTGL